MFKIGPDTFHIKKKVRRLPFGYKVSDDKTQCIPDEDILTLLSQAFDRIEEGHSLRTVADDLSVNVLKIRPDRDTRNLLSHAGLRKLFAEYRPEAARRKTQEFLAKQKPKTKPKKRIVKKSLKIANEKKKITYAKKRLEKLTGEKKELEHQVEKVEALETNPVFEFTTYEEPELEDNVIVGYRPNPGPQEEFLASSEFQVLYGGAAGGGKTMAIIMDPIRLFSNPNFFGLLLRRTTDELREIKQQTLQVYTTLFPKGHPHEAVWRENDSEWRFKNGGRLWLTYLDRDLDVKRFQGQAFTWVGFDELTHWPTSFPWDYLATRVRTTDPELKKHLSMRATTNPGGAGHGWVKRMFVDPAPYGKAFWATDPDTGEVLKDDDPNSETYDKPLFKRKFIPAKLEDNPFLSEDGMYRRSLLAQDSRRRDQLLYGDWTVADGAAFPEFRTHIHVVEPFEIPRTWTRFRSMDWGQQSKHAVHWYAINPDTNQIVVYREFYGGGKTAEQMASLIKYLEKQDNEVVSYGMLDSSVWHKRGEGPSPAEIMIGNGVSWRMADRSQGSRIAGKNMLHQLLAQTHGPYQDQPGIIFFNTCRHIISDLQVAPADPNGGDDIDERYRQQNHAYDSLRYGIMSRPRFVDPFLISSHKVYQPVNRTFGW